MAFVASDWSITRSNGNIRYIGDDHEGASPSYALGGLLTIVKTFNYTGADLTSIVLSGYTPGGISLTKTLTYSAGELVGITYS